MPKSRSQFYLMCSWHIVLSGWRVQNKADNDDDDYDNTYRCRRMAHGMWRFVDEFMSLAVIFQLIVACRLRLAAAGVAWRAGEVWISNVRGSIGCNRHMARRHSQRRFSSIPGIRAHEYLLLLINIGGETMQLLGKQFPWTILSVCLCPPLEAFYGGLLVQLISWKI